MTTTNKSEYRLENLTCASCAAKFEKNIKELPAVEEAQVNFGASKLAVVGQITVEEIEAAGAFDGITVVPEDKQERLEPPIPFYKRKENIVTVLSLLFLIIGATLSFIHDEMYPPAIIFFAISIAVGGASMFKTGIQNLLRLDFDMKTLMTIAIIGAVIIGEWREGAVIVFLFAVSEALEAYSMNKARQSIRLLMDIAPSSATVKRNGKFTTIPTKDIVRGDILIVKPGEKIAMDGIVATGSSTINQAAITGESVPVFKQQGDEVFAGTINEEGALEIKVTKLVGDTALAKIIHLVEEAQAEKAPSQKFVDRFAKYYTPVIMVIALLIAVIPPLLGADWNTWVYQGLAVLVVGCPCALVVSTPVAIVTAIGNAARHGVLIKGGIHLEETGQLHAVAFDKTGTLTKGYPEVSDFVVTEVDKEGLLSAIAAVESMSQHPLAKAIVHYAEKNNVEMKEVTNFQSVTGKGAYGTVAYKKIMIGSISWIEEFTIIPEDAVALASSLQREGKSVMAIMTENVYAGLVAVADPIREESKALLQRLKDIGIRHTVMLTGDHEQTGQAIGKALNMSDVRAGLMPEDKLKVVQQLQEQYGRVAMVGDGINDAPALAEATVGIAMGGAGTDAALETADIALMADDLTKLPYTIKLSRKTLRIIKENIMFALGLKIIALLLIIPGWLTLWIAIFADMGATILVVLNSLRLIRIEK
ncbi:heavy metal translocating P-type ATPase [Sporosarcina pasteurii]|uniref:Cd(2+)-exporting ATPase n=1 Tax=Sporosarcina pasteurii TaxID=1474 RepID=A0A380CIR5_SPOPA|nr:heavy metal translocating P-type ATPase [Sporosarcina pasteurii]MDS9472147.1 heavy metal translocating P-type ATPase [Sporosarcina pasteurii]QBQ06860.1 cadmium-translocating P-type ATPase [Sporosarcina pasteurii]SUJ20360.1 Probable cadmium-transporting ATPase [Sporosarcina pasteurii]